MAFDRHYYGWAVTHNNAMARITDDARTGNREKLLKAAAAAFATAGLDGANINDISLAAGLAKGTVYNYFPSKDALFLAVIEEACRLAAADSAITDPQAPTRDRLRAAVASDVAWALEHEPFARVLVRELFAGKPDLYERVVTAGAPYIEHVEQILADGVARADVRSDTPVDQLALIFTGLGLLGLAHHWGSGAGWPAPEHIPDLVVNIFFEGVRSGPGTIDAL